MGAVRGASPRASAGPGERIAKLYYSPLGASFASPEAIYLALRGPSCDLRGGLGFFQSHPLVKLRP